MHLKQGAPAAQPGQHHTHLGNGSGDGDGDGGGLRRGGGDGEVGGEDEVGGGEVGKGGFWRPDVVVIQEVDDVVGLQQKYCSRSTY